MKDYAFFCNRSLIVCTVYVKNMYIYSFFHFDEKHYILLAIVFVICCRVEHRIREKHIGQTHYLAVGLKFELFFTE